MRDLLLSYNPLTPMIEGYREAFFPVVAWVVFPRAEYEFAENV